MTIYERPAWHRWAACRGTMIDGKSDWFVPTGRFDIAARARLICSTCPIRRECADAGLSESHGMWGGTLPPDRRVARRNTPRTAACADCGTRFEYFVADNGGKREYCDECRTPAATVRRHNRRQQINRGGWAHAGISNPRRPGTLKIRPEPAPADRHDRIRWAAADALDDDTTTRRISGGAA